MVTDSSYQARVEAGMAWLDENHPGWERKIDLGTLNLGNGCDCILGQALRDLAQAIQPHLSGWAYGLHRLPEHPLVLGFVAGALENWEALEAEWRTAIKRRFDTGVLSDDGRPS